MDRSNFDRHVVFISDDGNHATVRSILTLYWTLSESPYERTVVAMREREFFYKGTEVAGIFKNPGNSKTKNQKPKPKPKKPNPIVINVLSLS